MIKPTSPHLFPAGYAHGYAPATGNIHTCPEAGTPTVLLKSDGTAPYSVEISFDCEP